MIKKFLKKKTSQSKAKRQITGSTIEEHREEILAKGRKFKYPIQYTKHKLVINTIVIGLVALSVAGVFGGLQLYKFHNTSYLAYRVTEFLHLPVANVDGETVLFSDYLMQYRSSIRVVEQQEGKISNNEDGRRQMNYYKRAALNNAITNAYAIKLARQKGITVSQQRIDAVFNEHLTSGDTQVTKTGFEKLVSDNFGLNLTEYKRMFIELPLLKQDVSVNIDQTAKQIVQQLAAELKTDGSNFDTVAQKFGSKIIYEPSSGLVGVQNQDGGRASEANKLSVGHVSKSFLSRSGDCYYIVKLLKKDNSQVEYASIRVPFTELQKRIDQLKKDGKIREFITIPTD
ncbi:SurA N-terminal domain-containing protein [Candidatus Saccharibacteria bacterium]|nr:SurA N-terminal domain-containing protein [Candidatus Saccharibacteria bacterium]